MTRQVYKKDPKTGEYKWFKVERSVAKEYHYVQDDTMPPTKHMADGKIYDSKSAFRRATKAAGCVEIGDAEPDLTPYQSVSESNSEREFIERTKAYLDGEGSDHVREINNFVNELSNGRKYS